MIVPSSARPPRRGAFRLGEHLLDDGLRHEAGEDVADVPALGVGLLPGACDGLERERRLVGKRLERGAILPLDAGSRLDLERAAPLAHHGEREELVHGLRPGLSPAVATTARPRA